MLGMSEGTSKWHLNNAREKLKVRILGTEVVEIKSKTA